VTYGLETKQIIIVRWSFVYSFGKAASRRLSPTRLSRRDSAFRSKIHHINVYFNGPYLVCKWYHSLFITARALIYARSFISPRPKQTHAFPSIKHSHDGSLRESVAFSSQ
jgi:hypothetical protein